VSDDERIKALEARVQELDRIIRTVVRAVDLNPAAFPLFAGKIYPASRSGGGSQP